MIVPALTRSKAKELALARLAGEHGGAIESLCHEIGTLPRGDANVQIDCARERLVLLMDEFTSRDGRIVETARFDSEAAVAIHSVLGDLPVRIASEHEFWLYLACGPMFDVVVRRYGEKSGKRFNLKNFGVGDIWDCLPRRLWYRGQVAYDRSAADPYELVKRGHVDFWISGLIRVLYGSHGPLARALVRFQYPEVGAFRGKEYGPSTLDVYGERGIREVYKRLRHFTATTELSALNEDQARSLIEDLVRDLLD